LSSESIPPSSLQDAANTALSRQARKKALFGKSEECRQEGSNMKQNIIMTVHGVQLSSQILSDM
jgi:hypothetical protein